MAREFKPKSKILGRYFKEAPLGLKEISSIYQKPIYELDQITQYQIVIVLSLINKRKEVLDLIMERSKTFLYDRFSALVSLEYNFKQLISMIKGISDTKKDYFLKFFLARNITNILFQSNFTEILTNKDIDLKYCQRDTLPYDHHNSFFTNRSKEKNFNRIKGSCGNITFEILKANDKRSMYLDEYSDCCQGFNNAGEGCMIDGIENPDAGFLVFERKGVIFAQGWIRKISKDVLLIDSIEFKGDFNKSLIDAIEMASEKLKKEFKEIYLGISPNRNEVRYGLKKYEIYEYGRHYNGDSLENNIRDIFSFVRGSHIYSDAKNKIICLTKKRKNISERMLRYHSDTVIDVGYRTVDIFDNTENDIEIPF